MAQKVQVLLIDDTDGSEATETVTFGLDGVEYEIDLSSGNAGRLRKALGKYVEHARKPNAQQQRRRRRKATVVDTGKVRKWARENGYDIKDRGRVPADLVEKYLEANPQ